MDFPNLFSQPGGGQSSNSLVQQQPEWKLPPTITPTVATGTPDPLGGMSDKLEGKSQALGMMLYALGGALRGDKDFVLKTLKLQDLQEGKKKQEEQKKAYQDLLKSMEGNYDQRMIDFAKVLGHEKGSELLMSTFKKTDDVPADIKKLEKFGLLKSKLDEGSEYYDPSYSLEDLNRDASILGVNARLLDKTEKQYIDDYMKEGRKEKTFSGQRIYTDEQLLEQAKKSYNLVYGGSPAPSPSPKIDEEEIIDLGRL